MCGVRYNVVTGLYCVVCSSLLSHANLCHKYICCIIYVCFVNSSHLFCVLQVESGFFLDCDVKIVGKSIRDRVALINWKRERTVSTGNGETQQNLLQVPSTGVPQGATLTTADNEDQEGEQQTLICTVPTTTSTTCKSLSQHTHECIICHPTSANTSQYWSNPRSL